MNLDEIIAAVRNCLTELQQSQAYTANARNFFHAFGEKMLTAIKECKYDMLAQIIQQGWDNDVDGMDELLDRIFLALDIYERDEFDALLKTAMGVPQ